jgi:hypothetical protein
MIDRYRLFYGYQDTTEQSVLEFAVETAWTCVPMPTHAERRKEKFLTSPKPDLAVGFCRENLFQNCDWDSFPKETQKIICYEGDELPNDDRAFYFLTIEAKHNFKNVDDPIALNQCLNNASQALHNMYEFFKEADRDIREDVKVKEDEYTKKFFERVCFFSVVAVAGAIKIRIHRACYLGKNDRTWCDATKQAGLLPPSSVWNAEMRIDEAATTDVHQKNSRILRDQQENGSLTSEFIYRSVYSIDEESHSLFLNGERYNDQQETSSITFSVEYIDALMSEHESLSRVSINPFDNQHHRIKGSLKSFSDYKHECVEITRAEPVEPRQHQNTSASPSGCTRTREHSRQIQEGKPLAKRQRRCPRNARYASEPRLGQHIRLEQILDGIGRLVKWNRRAGYWHGDGEKIKNIWDGLCQQKTPIFH